MEALESALNEIQRDIAQIRIGQTRHDEQIKTLYAAINEQKELTKSVQELTISVKALTTSVANTDRRLDSVSTDIKEIKAKPVKRWEKVIEVGITVVVTALITFFLTKAGLK